MDYRPANQWNVALASAMPNLLVVFQNVKRSYAFGLFDLVQGSCSSRYTLTAKNYTAS
jgi:hypothetical protein